MNTEEKTDFQLHYEKYVPVLQELRRKFTIPWQLLIKNEDPFEQKLYDWFPAHCVAAIKARQEERLYAERAGKILFALSTDDPHETDVVVLEAKKKLRSRLGMKEPERQSFSESVEEEEINAIH
jgi:hypothetical protein